MTGQTQIQEIPSVTKKKDADYVFFELTRSICPECRRVIDAHILLRDNKVYMRKRCPEHGIFETLIYGDAQAYASSLKFNKPGTITLQYSTGIERGCPFDCGLCPEHQQHACLGIIEVNSACNMDCPLCFADAGAGFNLTLEEVEDILDHFVETEGHPEVVQFSGGEPSIHSQIISMIEAAKARDIQYVMLNTNGKRIANDDSFLEQLAQVQPAIYFQFDGFDSETYRILRGEPDILAEKLRALDRLAGIGCEVVLVPAIERGVNEHEVGRIIQFGIEHPAVHGINFQPAFHSGRHTKRDPLLRMTIPDVIRSIEAQTEGMFKTSDFVPVPCCFPTCRSMSYAFVDGDTVIPFTRLLEIDDYLDYLSNRVIPDYDVRHALEKMFSSSATPGAEQALLACESCGIDRPAELDQLQDRVFMLIVQDFQDAYTLNVRQLMKCCVAEIVPDGRLIPFCAYNSVGYREQVREQMSGVPVAGVVPNAAPLQPLLTDSPYGSKIAGNGTGRPAVTR